MLMEGLEIDGRFGLWTSGQWVVPRPGKYFNIARNLLS